MAVIMMFALGALTSYLLATASPVFLVAVAFAAALLTLPPSLYRVVVPRSVKIKCWRKWAAVTDQDMAIVEQNQTPELAIVDTDGDGSDIRRTIAEVPEDEAVRQLYINGHIDEDELEQRLERTLE